MNSERRGKMSYLEIVVNNCIFLICPIALYLLYSSYKKNLDEEKDSLTFEIAIISSLYLVLRYGMPLHENYPTMLFDIPLLLCFFKKKTGFSILISIILIFYQTIFLHVHPAFLLLEYLVYFSIYWYLNQKGMTLTKLVHAFIITNSFFLSTKIFWFINPFGSANQNITYLIVIVFLIYLVAMLILSFFDQGEKIVDFNTSLYNIEKEKELRSSLFKVTHEIKNPIAVCKGYLDMLDPDNPKKVHKYVPIVRDEINRTLLLMDDFLDYTKIKINKEEIDLVMLIEELESSLASLFHKYNIKVSIGSEEDELYMEADYNRLKQVLINLLKNAVEAHDEQKSVRNIKIDLEQKEKSVSISIKDNGIGMDEEECHKICEMFFTTKMKGTGLGTALSKEIIELHGGTLQYFSRKGVGTEAKITLPKA